MRDEVVDGWKISQVEALIGLPRRDIQRACYDGSGGFGIVKPRNTTWGWRVYETIDLAKLFMLAQARKQGKTLDEIREELAPCENANDLSKGLARWEQVAREAREIHAGVSMSARALRCAIEDCGEEAFAGLIDASFAEDARMYCDAHLALELAAERVLSRLFVALARLRTCGYTPSSTESKEICGEFICGISKRCSLSASDAGMLLSHAANAPGMGLACELWLGSATWSYANEALEAFCLDVSSLNADEGECEVVSSGDAKESPDLSNN